MDTARIDVAEPAPAQQQAERAFNYSLIVSGIRCTLTYVILPFVAPLIGLAPFVGPVIGLPIAAVAIVANIVSIRRFWRVQHRWRWPVTFLHLGVLGLLAWLVYTDLRALL